MSFYEELSDILEEDVVENTVLQDCENWDSLSAITIVSLASSKYNVILNAIQLRSTSTAKDLFELIKASGSK